MAIWYILWSFGMFPTFWYVAIILAFSRQTTPRQLEDPIDKDLAYLVIVKRLKRNLLDWFLEKTSGILLSSSLIKIDMLKESGTFTMLCNIFSSRGRCYDHNFLQIFDNFRRKNWRFSQKPML
jgi:hypothetical protein